MQASEAMDTSPTTLKPTDTIASAAGLVMSQRYRSVPVVDDDYCYVGMFGVNCLLKQVIPKPVFIPNGLNNVSFIHESFDDLFERFNEVKDQPISICMNHDVKPVSPDTPLTETLLQLYETHASIPVVEKESCKLLGMISYWDVGEKIFAAGDFSYA